MGNRVSKDCDLYRRHMSENKENRGEGWNGASQLHDHVVPMLTKRIFKQ